MGRLEQAKQVFTAQIEQRKSQLSSHQAQILQYQFQLPKSLDLLAWLKAQFHYPKFYLALRDEDKQIAALGKVRSFSDVDFAQDFVNQQHLPLVGGLQFSGQGQFILPQIFIEQDTQGCTISFFVEENNLSAALEILKTLEKTTALSPLKQLEIVQIVPKAKQSLWCDWVNLALNKIQKGELSKLVLANETLFQLDTAIDPQDFLNASQAQNQGCYHFLWAENENQTFVGSTPERLFARHERQLWTEALAGTAPVSDNPNENKQRAAWLLQDEKNLAENWLVVEDISQNIKGLTEQISVSDVALKPLRKVQHLIRKIQGNLTALCQDADLLKAIQPTAAVSGLPQQAAKIALKEIETFDRSWYAGTLGVMKVQASEFCVTIRSAFIEADKIRVFAGAGIVAGSNPLEEWLEIERKAAGLISLFAENNGE